MIILVFRREHFTISTIIFWQSWRVKLLERKWKHACLSLPRCLTWRHFISRLSVQRRTRRGRACAPRKKKKKKKPSPSVTDRCSSSSGTVSPSRRERERERERESRAEREATSLPFSIQHLHRPTANSSGSHTSTLRLSSGVQSSPPSTTSSSKCPLAVTLGTL